MKMTSKIRTPPTRTELPSGEATNDRKGNVGSIVRPVTKVKASTNLRQLSTSNFSKLVLN